MKHFIKYVLLFLSPLLLIAAGFEFYLRHQPNAYRTKSEWMEAHADSVETLVLGNSQTYYGVRPSQLEGKAFNLANISQRPDYDRWLLEHYAPRCPRLRRIVLSLSCFTLSDPRFEDCEEWFLARYYRLYMGCDVHSCVSKYAFETSDYKTAKQKFLLSLHHEQTHPCDALGWGADYELSHRSADLSDDKANAEQAKRHETKSRAAVRYNLTQLEDIAAYCHRHGLRLFLVTTPCWHGYVKHLNKEQVAEMRSTAQKLSKTYGCRYLNYLEDNRFIAYDFFDTNHLSDVGARKFTDILKNDMR